MGKRKLGPDEYWAQVIYRAQQAGKDKIYALVRHKYTEDDIEATGPGEFIGLKHIKRYTKQTDQDPESETFGQRIDKPDSEPIGTQLVYEDAYTPENVTKYKKMVGVNNFGETKFVWKFKQMNISGDHNPEEFWEIKQNEAYDKYVSRNPVIKIDTNKKNKHHNS